MTLFPLTIRLKHYTIGTFERDKTSHHFATICINVDRFIIEELFMKKIAFFDIDGTLTSEIDGSVPASAKEAIKKARDNGNLMFINTGRCYQNVEPRFREIGFDGFICGCGTNIYADGKELFHQTVSHDITLEILNIARETNVDLLFESKKEVAFDLSRPLIHPSAVRQHQAFVNRDYQMPTDFTPFDFCCDKFVIWYQTEDQLTEFRKVSDAHFTCIDRGGTFREFVPHGFSKATGIQYLLDYYHLDKSNAYAFGDSNNDLPMLNYVPNSIAMGNSDPKSLFNEVSYVTGKASEDGIKQALEYFKFE